MGLPEVRSLDDSDHDIIDIVAYSPSTEVAEKKPRPSFKKVFAFLVFLLLLCALLFVFTARSVWIQIEPQADVMTLKGAWLRVAWKDHFLMPRGDIEVHATREGYYPLAETVTINKNASQKFHFTLQKLPGKLQFKFDEAVTRATVYVGDDYQLGDLNGELEVPAGEYKLRVESPRYQTYEALLEVIGLGKTQNISIDLRPNWSDVTVASIPVDAQVYVDDKLVGVAPGTFSILAGEHQLSLRATGYKRWFKTLNLMAEQPLQIGTVKLIKADGTLQVSTQPVSAAIAVNGQYKGMAPQTLKLPPGRAYTISASKVGYAKITQQVTVRSDEDLIFDWHLEALLGDVTIKGAPASASVWKNGQQIGRAGEVLTLSAADQMLELRAPGYASETVNVLPKPKLPQIIEVSMLTVAQARAAELQRKSMIKTADGQTLLLQRPTAFKMGASRRARGRRSNETLRDVKQLPMFYIATHEVTNKQFKAYNPAHNSGSAFKVSLEEADHPVVNVSWDDAARYCNWLSKRDGLPDAYREINGAMAAVSPRNTGYRLPTEAEWAWAARYSGQRKQTLFPWGEDSKPPKDFGNFADITAVGLTGRILSDYNDAYAATAPVGSFKADSAGLYDMAGNVSEWMHDVYRASSLETTGSTATGRPHAIRGSSWQHSRISELRPTYRDFSDQPRADLGFRIGRTLE